MARCKYAGEEVIELRADPRDRGKRLDVFVHERQPEWSRSRVQEWVRAGRVRVNGGVEKPSYGLRGDEAIEVEPARLAPLRAVAEDIPLSVLFEDDSMVAIDKPAGMVVHAGAGVDSGTVVNALLHRFGSLSSLGGDLRPGIVHRLDRYTSGVLLVAKTDAAHQALARQFASRTMRKNYLALVHRPMEAKEGRIDKPIARDPIHRTRMTAALGSGRAAITTWRVLQSIAGFSYLAVQIGTGRTHQIRVHLASIRHPVVRDTLYGAPEKIPGMPSLGRHFLHAAEIEFRHPQTGKPMRLAAPLPQELEEWLEQLRTQAHNSAIH